VIKEHSCKVIIDGGSCNNIASSDMVERLGLATRSHPQPYYIQWLNSCGKLKVTMTVHVHFSIGSYADLVDCDVVPMQACSLLLGRPWQYDKNTTHHGHSNKYSFVHKDKKFSLIPMLPEEIIKDDLDRAEHERKQREVSSIHKTGSENHQPKLREKKEKSEKKSEVPCKGHVLLATKSEIRDLLNQPQELMRTSILQL
jgi:hypothetical protein